MAGVQDIFSNLHRRRLDWSFRVYVKRIFEHRFFGSEDFTLEIVLQDAEEFRTGRESGRGGLSNGAVAGELKTCVLVHGCL
ncbi:hypothetical protein PIB30_083098 [Stylosanthes scabra]|uniref:Uncharacterized protein n=1 Tax=Stylosanthes scabra TaxID=79078 RepID=A0ABU6US86_9FABA|nr:hypothetical protein [Stylosanthes scabra]